MPSGVSRTMRDVYAKFGRSPHPTDEETGLDAAAAEDDAFWSTVNGGAAESDDDEGGTGTGTPQKPPPPELTDAQMERIDRDLGPISAGLRAALRDKKRRGGAYLNLCSYLVFMAIYMFVVYVQSDVYNAFTVTSSAGGACVCSSFHFSILSSPQ